ISTSALLRSPAQDGTFAPNGTVWEPLQGMAAVSGASLIACVEDDPAVREAVEGLLVRIGFTTLGLSSAEAFLQSSRLVDTSCLITDVSLGGMSGFELQNGVATSGYPSPTIVITT